MIQADIGDNAAVRFDHVDRVKPPAHTHFQYGRSHVLFVERNQRGKRPEFEIG